VVNALCGQARELAEPFVDAVVERISALDQQVAGPPGLGHTVIRIPVSTTAGRVAR